MRQATADAILAQLDEHGWCQGDYVNEAGQICLAQAVTQAHPGNHLDRSRDRARLKTELYLAAERLFPGRRPGDVTTFNDDPATSEEDVRLVVKSCVNSP